ncbi:MAG TPA: hypothetical protein VD999_06845 [Vitreimonas sp.]|nr:hypothetical protein [Vitreimonas sp.]
MERKKFVLPPLQLDPELLPFGDEHSAYLASARPDNQELENTFMKTATVDHEFGRHGLELLVCLVQSIRKCRLNEDKYVTGFYRAYLEAHGEPSAIPALAVVMKYLYLFEIFFPEAKGVETHFHIGRDPEEWASQPATFSHRIEFADDQGDIRDAVRGCSDYQSQVDLVKRIKRNLN